MVKPRVRKTCGFSRVISHVVEGSTVACDRLSDRPTEVTLCLLLPPLSQQIDSVISFSIGMESSIEHALPEFTHYELWKSCVNEGPHVSKYRPLRLA